MEAHFTTFCSSEYVWKICIVLSYWKFGVNYSKWHYLRDSQRGIGGFLAALLEDGVGLQLWFYTSVILKSVAWEEMD